ncbi:MAG: hypothetical protein JWR50_3711 [Mucilaginibacter sp.]|nr:hypothetical protein [Mucilaginibacter sp.]
MKKLYYILPLMVFAFFLNSCKKSSKPTGTGTPATKPKYLVQVTQVSTGPAALGSPVSTSFTYYTYDSKKRLSTVKSGNNLTNYVYQDDGNLYSTDNVNNVDNYRIYYVFTYDGGKLTSYTLQRYSGTKITAETTYTYVYNGGRATELHFDIYYQLFTYDSNGNITKISYHGDTEFSTVYTYDNKKNAFINAPFKYPLFGDISRLSPNNQITNTTEGLSTNILTTTNYNYDSDGYPIAGTSSSDYANSSSSKFTYIYGTLE